MAKSKQIHTNNGMTGSQKLRKYLNKGRLKNRGQIQTGSYDKNGQGITTEVSKDEFFILN